MKYGINIEKIQVDYIAHFLNLPDGEEFLGAFDCGSNMLVVTSARLIFVSSGRKIKSEVAGGNIANVIKTYFGMSVELREKQDNKVMFKFYLRQEEKEDVANLLNSIKEAPSPPSLEQKSICSEGEWRAFRKNASAVAAKNRGKSLGYAQLTYNGGFGNSYKKNKTAFLECYENEVLFSHKKAPIAIPANQITGFEVTGQKQTSPTSRLTATRMVTLGVFSLAAPKRSTVTTKEAYVCITLKDGRQLFFYSSSYAPEKIHRKLADAISHYSSLQTTKDNQVQVPTTQTIDVAGEIARFADLKKQGILTDEEFETKKKQLLEL